VMEAAAATIVYNYHVQAVETALWSLELVQSLIWNIVRGLGLTVDGLELYIFHLLENNIWWIV
jgi:hypothetical protein